jgi:hypothetical protein
MIYLHLPGCLDNAGHFTLQSQFTEADTAQTEAADISARASATLTAVTHLNGIAPTEFTILHAFLRHTLLRFLPAERHTKHLQQSTRVLIGFGRGHNRDLHTAQFINFVVLDFRKHQLILETQCVITASIKRICRDTAEITDARQCDIQQAVNE